MADPLQPITELLVKRDKTHGPFPDQAATTQSLKYLIRHHPKWDDLNDMQRESLEMIAHKIARILAGDPNEPDHWNDIAGYAMLPVKFAEDVIT